MVQALAFAELLAGGILFLAGLSGHSPAEVLKGEAGKKSSWLGLKKNSSAGPPSPSGGGSGATSEPSGGVSSAPLGGAPAVGGGSATPPSQAAKKAIQKTKENERIKYLIKHGGPKGHLTPQAVTEFLHGKLKLNDIEKSLGTK